MKLSAPHIVEGVVTGLVVAAIGYVLLQLYKHLTASAETSAQFYAGNPTPAVTGGVMEA